MAGYEYSFSALCEECKIEFSKRMMLYSSINIDANSTIVKDFLHDRLNLVTCPHCGSSFVYERPFAAYSINKKYAILVDASVGANSKLMGRARLYDIFALRMKFRLVDFLCEASEKSRIFNAGLDDRAVNHLKKSVFDESYFQNKREAMVLFEKVEDANIFFVFKDYLGSVIERRKVALGQYRPCIEDDVCAVDGQILWKRTE